MECGLSLDELIDFVRGRCSSSSRSSIIDHISACETCLAIIEELRKSDPHTVRSFFLAPTDISDSMPFPQRIRDLVATSRMSARLRMVKNIIEELSQRCISELTVIIERWKMMGFISQPTPALVRSGEEVTVNVDLINLTDIVINEQNLEPSVGGNTWLLAGFPMDLIGCRSFMLLMPVQHIREMIPEWEPDHSQEIITHFMRTMSGESLFLDPVISIPGRISDGDIVSMAFELNDELSRIIQNRNDIVPAIVVLP